MTSIRRRTSVLVALSVTTLIALGGLALVLMVRTTLTRQFDDGLAARAAALQSLTKFDGEKVELDTAGGVSPAYHDPENAEYFIAWIKEGAAWRELGRSESLRESASPLVSREPPALGAADAALPDGRSGRSLAVEFVPVTDPDPPDDDEPWKRAAAPGRKPPGTAHGPVPAVRVFVARSRETLDRTLWTIALTIASVGLVLIGASGAATRWAVRRGTRPLDALSAQVAALGPSTLHQRLATESLPSELTPIAGRLNDLLARLDGAFARERRFTSAASHELRTPIAELRALLEVALERERSPQRWEHTARDGLAVLDRAQRLIEALLHFSRATSSTHAAQAIPVTDLALVMKQEAARALDVRGRDHSHLSIDAPTPLRATIDATVAASIIGNLIDNALRHGDVHADRPVRCVAARNGTGVTVTIRNHAPDLTGDDLPRLFEAFWRKDSSRTQSGGFGLGLAVGRALAESAGGSLTCELDATHTLSATLRVGVATP